MKKYYRVKKDTFLWKAGAILHADQNSNCISGRGYVAIEDIWDVAPLGEEYISAVIIEHPNNAEFFERVYPDTLSGKLFYTKDKLIEVYEGAFK